MLKPEDPNHSDVTPTCASPRLVLALLSVSKATRALTGLKLAEMGFASGQDELLLALDEEEPVSVSVLADRVSVRPSTISKMIDRLLAKGLVERVTCKSDHRRTMVKITPSGLDARSLLLDMRSKLDDELMVPLAQDSDAMIQSLEQVAIVVRTKLRRLR